MNKAKILLMVFSLCALPVSSRGAENVPNSSEAAAETTVKIALTTFDVNDQTLRLTYEIKNGSDEDIWVCEGIQVLGAPTPGLQEYEVYLERDATLVLRKRLEVPEELSGYYIRAFRGTYVRLHPGKKRTETMSLALPIEPYHILSFWDVHGVQEVSHLVLKVGLYHGDLPGMIRRICELSEMLNCEELTYPDVSTADIELLNSYFGGLAISQLFGGLSGFNEAYEEGSDRITIPHMWPVRLGERSLKMTIDGLSLPYAWPGN